MFVRHHRHHRVAGALVRHVQGFDARHRGEEHAAQMTRRPDPGRSHRVLLGIGREQGDQLAHACRRHGRMHREQALAFVGERHRQEVVQRIVRHLLLVDVRRDREAGRVAAPDGVAVRSRLGDQVDAEEPARARPAVDDHLLPEHVAERLGDDARQDVGARAGGVRQNVADRSIWVVGGRIGRCGLHRRCRYGGGDGQQRAHCARSHPHGRSSEAVHGMHTERGRVLRRTRDGDALQDNALWPRCRYGRPPAPA
jgi:hypothetical protein